MIVGAVQAGTPPTTRSEMHFSDGAISASCGRSCTRARKFSWDESRRAAAKSDLRLEHRVPHTGTHLERRYGVAVPGSSKCRGCIKAMEALLPGYEKRQIPSTPIVQIEPVFSKTSKLIVSQARTTLYGAAIFITYYKNYCSYYVLEDKIKYKLEFVSSKCCLHTRYTWTWSHCTRVCLLTAKRCHHQVTKSVRL